VARSRHVRRLLLVSGALLVYWVAMFVLAVTQDWPAEFGAGEEDRPETIPEWIWRGSLVHAPLPPLVAQLVFTGLVQKRARRWRMIGGFSLAVVGALYTIGGLGEPLRPELSDPPRVPYLALRAVGVALSLALTGFGIAAALSARRGDDASGRDDGRPGYW
jgi:hypothetical protein